MRFGVPSLAVLAIALVALVGCPGGDSSKSGVPGVQSVNPSSGDTTGGLSISIMGARFRAGAMVSIGGAPASNVVVVSSQQITANTPGGTPGPADLVVMNPNGKTGVLPGGFTYLPPAGGSFSLTPVMTGLNFPICVAFAPDWAATGRLFFTEKGGAVRVAQDFTLIPQPFVSLTVNSAGDRGLMGIVFDPDYATNRHVYIFYDDTRPMQRIVRYEDSSNVGINPYVVLDDLPTNASSHNAGNMAFGPDGKLYVTLGDDVVPAQADDLSVSEGKILRMNPDGSAPTDNPWYDGTLPRSLIYARGLRNSFDFAFHPVSGDLYATENGPGAADEVNLIVSGGHFGWDASAITGDRMTPPFIDPVDTFTPEPALTGIAFNVGFQYPATYMGDAFIADWRNGEIQRVDMNPPNYTYDRTSRATVVTAGSGIIDIVAGPDGYLYISTSGAISRIEYN